MSFGMWMECGVANIYNKDWKNNYIRNLKF